MKIRKLRLTFKWQDVRMSYLEGIFARGNRRVGRVIERAYRAGCRFDGWTEHLDHDKWDRALQGIDRDFYIIRKRCYDEIFPWDHIDCGVSKDYLWTEYQKALEGIFTPDCRKGKCHGCGVCTEEDRSQAFQTRVRGDREKRELNRMPSTAAESRNQLLKRAHDYQRLRVRFAKLTIPKPGQVVGAW